MRRRGGVTLGAKDNLCGHSRAGHNSRGASVVLGPSTRRGASARAGSPTTPSWLSCILSYSTAHMSYCIWLFCVCTWLYTWKQRVSTSDAAVHSTLTVSSFPAWSGGEGGMFVWRRFRLGCGAGLGKAVCPAVSQHSHTCSWGLAAINAASWRCKTCWQQHPPNIRGPYPALDPSASPRHAAPREDPPAPA
jgi:hypothetical protein